MDERRSLTHRLARRLLALPDPVFRRITGGERVVIDGRVLDLRLQALIVLAEKVGYDRATFEPERMRQELGRLSGVGMPSRRSVRAVDRFVPGPCGDIPVRLYRRFDAVGSVPAIVYFHGGGWVTGDLDSHDGSCRLIADTTGCLVVAVDYRLAPEHPFPAAVDDALAAYGWVHDQVEELGVVPGRVGVMGDSAGGNLAAVVALGSPDRVPPPPVAQCLVYPAVDMRFLTESHRTLADGFFLTRETMEWFRAQYIPSVSDWESPLVSPLLADDLSRCAPALIVTAGFDPLRDDGWCYAEALRAAGVAVTYRCYDDLVHGFFGMGALPGGMAVATGICSAMGDLMRAG